MKMGKLTLGLSAMLMARTLWGVDVEKVGGEFRPAESPIGDQVHPAVAYNGLSGYIVWQDNATDGDGTGISARKIGPQFASSFGAFRVNKEAKGDQENPKVTLLKEGGAAFVWQSGELGFQRIIARILRADGTFVSGDIAISPLGQTDTRDPVVTQLQDGTIVVAWGSMDIVGSLQDVYFQRVGVDAKLQGEPVIANSYREFNQRNPDLLALLNGKFVLAWVSEQQRTDLSADIMLRKFNPDGSPSTDELPISNFDHACSSPSIILENDGSILASWSEILAAQSRETDEGWNVVARRISGDLQPLSTTETLNQYRTGEQSGSHLAFVAKSPIAVWTSRGQDGSLEGVFGRWLNADGTGNGDEFQVNTTSFRSQMHPILAGGGTEAVVIWTSFSGLDSGFDLVAQRLAPIKAPLTAPEAPLVTATSSSRLIAAWGVVNGLDVAGYEVTFDENTKLQGVSNYSLSPAFLPGSEHTVRYSYKLKDGRVSPLSEATVATTWGEDLNSDGIPDDWQAKYFGDDPSSWPDPSSDTDGDGVSNLREFLAGTSPTDASSALRSRFESDSQGRHLVWDTVPGIVYQVETSSDLKNWIRFGSSRLATGTTDAVGVAGDNSSSYFRIVRIR